MFRSCECNNAVLFRHTKAFFFVVWREQQSGSSWRRGHCCRCCVPDVIFMVVFYDAQADTGIYFQGSTGMNLLQVSIFPEASYLSIFSQLASCPCVVIPKDEHLTLHPVCIAKAVAWNNDSRCFACRGQYSCLSMKDQARCLMHLNRLVGGNCSHNRPQVHF